MDLNQIKNNCMDMLNLIDQTFCKPESLRYRIIEILHLIEQEENAKFFVPDASYIFERIHKEEITSFDTFDKLNETIDELKRTANRLEELKDNFVSEENLCPKCGCELQSIPYYERVEYQDDMELVEFTNYVCDNHGTQGIDF
jgi:hypothetical protein